MSIFDIFKKKKPEKKPSSIKAKEGKEKEKTKKPTEEPKKEVRVEKEEKVEIPKVQKGKKKFTETYKILKSLHITEKATDLNKKNQYVFEIFPKANKTEVKKAIEETFGVNVLSVKTVKTPAKKRRLGRIRGWKKGFKKAIVRIKEGQKIEVLPK